MGERAKQAAQTPQPRPKLPRFTPDRPQRATEIGSFRTFPDTTGKGFESDARRKGREAKSAREEKPFKNSKSEQPLKDEAPIEGHAM